MRILGIETTEPQATVALLDDDEIVSELTLGNEARSASLLAPGIRQALIQVDWQPTDLDRIVVPVGPGSFTGLRVGVTTAKTLGYALGIEVVGLNTLEVLAAQVSHTGLVEVVMDARRNELFCQRFLVRDDTVVPCGKVRIEDDLKWSETVADDVLVTGPVLQKLAPQLTGHVQLADRKDWTPRASTVAWLGAQQDPCSSVFELCPKYYRKSAAEEKRDLR